MYASTCQNKLNANKKKKKMTQVDEQQQQNCFHKKMVHILKSSLMVKTRKSFDFVSWFMI